MKVRRSPGHPSFRKRDASCHQWGDLKRTAPAGLLAPQVQLHLLRPVLRVSFQRVARAGWAPTFQAWMSCLQRSLQGQSRDKPPAPGARAREGQAPSWGAVTSPCAEREAALPSCWDRVDAEQDLCRGTGAMRQNPSWTDRRGSSQNTAKNTGFTAKEQGSGEGRSQGDMRWGWGLPNQPARTHAEVWSARHPWGWRVRNLSRLRGRGPGHAEPAGSLWQRQGHRG